MRKRIVYIDVLRILACLAVIYNHAGGYFLFGEQEPGGLLYRLELGMSIACKYAVPVFFAVSGALLLDREVSLRELLGRRFLRMALTLAVFSMLSHALDMVRTGTPFDAGSMLLRLYEDNLNFSYWYLYAYLAFLLISPLLGAMLRSLDNRGILYMLGLAFAARCVLSAFEAWRWAGAHRLNPDFNLTFVTCDAVLYPAMGYFLHHRLSVKACRRWAPMLLAGAVVSVLVCIELNLQQYYRTWVPKVEPVADPAALLLGAAVFASVRALLGDWQSDGRPARILSYVGGLTFGIYLVHVPVLRSGMMTAAVRALHAALPVPMIVSLMEVIMTAAVSGAIAALLRKIPGVRRLLGA